MKNKSYPQYAIIKEESASELTDKLNKVLRQLDDERDLDVQFEGMTARVKYMVTERDIPECLADEYQKVGVRLYCEDCPYFEPVRKKDGKIDERKKLGGCPFTERGVAFRDSKACDILYQAINNKEVRLCLAR